VTAKILPIINNSSEGLTGINLSRNIGTKNKANSEPLDSGIVIVDDDLSVDKESELEERRAYLEEARSQEASSD